MSGANIKARDEDGNTALALAAAAGKVDVVDVLLAVKADVNAGNRSGERPLMLAAAKGTRMLWRAFWLADPMSLPERKRRDGVDRGRARLP